MITETTKNDKRVLDPYTRFIKDTNHEKGLQYCLIKMIQKTKRELADSKCS